MNIYRISQDVNHGYDVFDSAIVCANTEEEAVRIHPKDNECPYGEVWWDDYDNLFEEPMKRNVHCTWVHRLSDVEVEFIGTTNGDYKVGDILCASFNAG